MRGRDGSWEMAFWARISSEGAGGQAASTVMIKVRSAETTVASGAGGDGPPDAEIHRILGEGDVAVAIKQHSLPPG